ncbi:MAG: ribosomal L7Ae/L30e/S12e/Gadd45 family protein, partial [Gemmatimonadales bacterium]
MSGLLGLLGLGYRGGRVVVGVDAVRRELQAGKCWCVVLAEDASPRAVDKVVRLARAKGVQLMPGPRAA